MGGKSGKYGDIKGNQEFILIDRSGRKRYPQDTRSPEGTRCEKSPPA
jgi:nitrogen fixation-related uncharacterized protein